jgi:hypothetical protein
MVLQGQWDQAALLAERVLADAKQAGDRPAAGYALHVIGLVAYHRRDPAAMLRGIDQALAVIGDDLQTADLRILLLSNRAAVLDDLDQAEARAAIGEALALAERTGTPGWAPSA